MKKILPLGILLLCLVSDGYAQTITSNTTITQTWIDAHAIGPWSISDGVTVTFGENLTISSTTQYFDITTNNVTIDGAGHTVTLHNITGFRGLVKSGTGAGILIKNSRVVTSGLTTLAASAGYIAATNNRATIRNCSSSGNITEQFSGGIAGDLNSGSITNCYSTGAISGTFSGGIVGERNTGSITNCYTSGVISGSYSGGISGSANNGTITNCYSTGRIDGFFSGGIAGVDNKINGSISNCYTTGSISGNAGGITGKGNAGSISNCFTTGIIADGGGVIVGTEITGSISNNNNTVQGNWTDANTYLLGTSGVGAIWNTIVTPYTLLPLSTLLLTNPSASLTSCLGVASASPVSFGIQGSALTASVTISAPANFEVASTINGTYATSLVLDVTSGTVTSTLFVRLTASAPSGTTSGTITASSSGATNVTTTTSGTVNPSFVLSQSSINLCNNASFLMSASTSFPVSNGWTSADPSITVNSSGYVTAGVTNGSFLISYTDACAQTISATVNVGSTSSITITDYTALPNYKFISNTPQGSVDLTNSGTNNYVGYNGFTYSSQTRPTNTGYYRVSKQIGNEAGCPVPFYIIKCDACN